MIGRIAAAGALLSLGHLGLTAVAAVRLRLWDARRAAEEHARGSGGPALRRSRPGEQRGAASDAIDVLLVRPCRGTHPELVAALASTAGVRTRHRLRVVLAVAGASDPAALPAARAAALLRARGIDAEVRITEARGANGKASQLAAVLDGAMAAEVAIVADDDVDLDGVDLDLLVDRVRAERAGAAWAAPVEAWPRTRADRASSAILGASLHAFAVLHALDGAGMVGKLFAVRLEALAEAGGFGALRDVLGEDVELARRLRALGWPVTMAPLLARSRAGGRSSAQVVDRYARWIAMVRAQRPHLLIAYPACFLAPALTLAVAVASLPFAPAAALASGGTALAARAASAALAASRCAPTEGSAAWSMRDALLGDVLLAAAFARAMMGNGLQWRGRRLVIDAQGRLREETQHAAA